ncbi:uncharacterized protein METZ01_LOCUS216179 [marine metagenome]|uniref:Uncharacterized protein n=1 Tax=marine metagenome TaxID=408172 RepID=A0A382FL30_9ZZZZ
MEIKRPSPLATFWVIARSSSYAVGITPLPLRLRWSLNSSFSLIKTSPLYPTEAQPFAPLEILISCQDESSV